MNICSNCGKMAGLHSSVVQGCTCQYSMQAPPRKREWVGLTPDERANILRTYYADMYDAAEVIEELLKEKNL